MWRGGNRICSGADLIVHCDSVLLDVINQPGDVKLVSDKREVLSP